MKKAILELDLGNTRIKWRVLVPGSETITGQCDYQSGIATAIRAVTSNRVGGLTTAAIERVRVASVVTQARLNAVLRECRELCAKTPELATVQAQCGAVRAAYANLQNLGVDRWLALLAANKSTNNACVVVSCGTAVTVDLITAAGQHLGGYIAPGLQLMRESLFNGTHSVRLDTLPIPENLSPGVDTAPAVSKGVLLMLQGLIDNARAQLPHEDGAVQVVVTGGDALTLIPFISGRPVYNEHLVLDGLAIALP